MRPHSFWLNYLEVSVGIKAASHLNRLLEDDDLPFKNDLFSPKAILNLQEYSMNIIHQPTMRAIA